jgi:hypothetical protein
VFSDAVEQGPQRTISRPNKVTPRRIAAQMRRRDALVLRGKGRTYQQIADALGYSSAGEARKQIIAAFAHVVDEPAQELLTLQLERLNTLLGVPWGCRTRSNGELRSSTSSQQRRRRNHRPNQQPHRAHRCTPATLQDDEAHDSKPAHCVTDNRSNGLSSTDRGLAVNADR